MPPVVDSFETPWGPLSLKRWPGESKSTLRAWDAADELLLHHLATLYDAEELADKSVLVVNDAHGALSCALHAAQPVNWSDSYLAHQSARMNVDVNFPGSECQTLPSVKVPPEPIDIVLIKIPKTIALLEDQLARLRPVLNSGAIIIAAAMIRHLPRSAFVAIERFLGPLTTSLAVKKARLIFARLDSAIADESSPYPTQYKQKTLGISLINHANVFSRERLDIGTRFFLQQFHRLPPFDRAIDLACGNGVLGLHLLKQCSDGQIAFVDESYMALESAQTNVHRLTADKSATCEFVIADGLGTQAPLTADLVVCNPPFHSQHAVMENTARQFFKQSHLVLRKGGELWFVANRHLNYRQTAKHIFGHCDHMAENSKFTVYRSLKR